MGSNRRLEFSLPHAGWNGRYETNSEGIDSIVPARALLQSCHEARGEKFACECTCVLCNLVATTPSKVVSQRPRI